MSATAIAPTPTPEFDATKNIETWEITTGGTVWVWLRDPREIQGYRKQRVGGRSGGSKRLHISTDDRRFNQEQVIEEMRDQDPFTNGMLRLITENHIDDINSAYHYTDEALAAVFDDKDEKSFSATINAVESELILRRLQSIAPKYGTIAQNEALDTLIAKRYPIGGTQRSVREMIAAGEVAGGETLSNR